MENIFDSAVIGRLRSRIEALTPESQPLWGKMSADQMLAHCNVTYEMLYEQRHPRPGPLMRLMLRWFVKGIVTGEKPYPKNSRTAPSFVIGGPRELSQERDRLLAYLEKTKELGRDAFEGKDSHSFGRLTAGEWNTMMYKHLDHHLRQFGV